MTQTLEPMAVDPAKLGTVYRAVGEIGATLNTAGRDG